MLSAPTSLSAQFDALPEGYHLKSQVYELPDKVMGASSSFRADYIFAQFRFRTCLALPNAPVN